MGKITKPADGGYSLARIEAGNFYDRGRAFMAANGGTGFVIALEPFKTDNQDYPQTLPQWGAWRQFFRMIKLQVPYMDRATYYTVPAEWPHLFAANATVQGDHAAGEAFERKYLAEKELWRRTRKGDPAIREIAAAAAKALMRKGMQPWRASWKPCDHDGN